MSNCKFKAENPEDIKFTLELTLPLARWREIRNNLNESYCYPMSELTAAIRDCVLQAEKTYCPKGESND